MATLVIRSVVGTSLAPGADLPEDPFKCRVRVDFEIGLDGETGAEWFFVIVCTTSMLQEDYRERGFAWGRRVLYVDVFDWDVIMSAVSRLLRNAPAGDWDTKARYVAEFMHWEHDE